MRGSLFRVWMGLLSMALIGSMGIERAGAQDDRGILPGEVSPPMPELDAAKLTKAKLRRIRISVDFENTTFSEAADYFRQVARELDRHELDPNLKGINVVVRSKELGRRNTGVFKLENHLRSGGESARGKEYPRIEAEKCQHARRSAGNCDAGGREFRGRAGIREVYSDQQARHRHVRTAGSPTPRPRPRLT